MRPSTKVSLALLCLTYLVFPGIARADEVIATVARPTPIATLDGRIVWSDYDAATKRYHLTQRLDGATTRLPVAPRSVPFDVDLGPDVDGKPVAAYSRCRRDPPPRSPPRGAIAQMPEWRLGRGCDIYLYSFEQGREVRVPHTSSRGGSEFLPTVWTDRIAFARRYERRQGRRGRRAYLYARPNTLFADLGRSGHTRRLPAGPSTGPGPTALDLATRRLAFGWDSTDPRPHSAVYLDVMRNTGRTAKRRLDHGHSGELQGREFIAPQFDQQVRVTWLASFEGDKTQADVRRYSFMTGRQEEAMLGPLPADKIWRTAIAGAVDGDAYLYLASGLINPGCSDAEPCLVLRNAAPVFSPR